MNQSQPILQQAVGVETTRQSHTPLFGKGLHLPVACTIDLSTASDQQTSITVHMLQGDSLEAKECQHLTNFMITGIASGQPRREPKLKVTFAIDANGTLECQATELPEQQLAVAGGPVSVAIDA